MANPHIHFVNYVVRALGLAGFVKWRCHLSFTNDTPMKDKLGCVRIQCLWYRNRAFSRACSTNAKISCNSWQISFSLHGCGHSSKMTSVASFSVETETGCFSWIASPFMILFALCFGFFLTAVTKIHCFQKHETGQHHVQKNWRLPDDWSANEHKTRNSQQKD